MKHLLLWLGLLLFSQTLCGQNLQVYSVTGEVQMLSGGEWVGVGRRSAVAPQTRLRLGERSAVSVVDNAQKQVFSYGKSGTVTVGEITAQKSSLLKKYAENFSVSLNNGQSGEISHKAMVVYRNDGEGQGIYNALLNPNYIGCYNVSMDVVECGSDRVLGRSIRIGQQIYFRIRNGSDEPLFVNVLSIDANDEWVDCFPADKALTLSHLLVPAHSEVDFKEYPLEVAEPVGPNQFLLIAYDKPFNLALVRELHEKNTVATQAQTNIGTFTQKTTIQ